MCPVGEPQQEEGMSMGAGMLLVMSPAAAHGKGSFTQGNVGMPTLQNFSVRSSPPREDEKAGRVLPAQGTVSNPPIPLVTTPEPWKFPIHAWHCQQLPEANLPADPGKSHFFQE